MADSYSHDNDSNDIGPITDHCVDFNNNKITKTSNSLLSYDQVSHPRYFKSVQPSKEEENESDEYASGNKISIIK
jgi:hypothetical protein